MKLPQPEKERVLRAISKLPYEGDIKRLQGKKSRGLLRLRVGDYRIIYTIDDGLLVVCVIDAGNRGQIKIFIKNREGPAQASHGLFFFSKTSPGAVLQVRMINFFSGVHRALLRLNTFQGNK